MAGIHIFLTFFAHRGVLGLPIGQGTYPLRVAPIQMIELGAAKQDALVHLLKVDKRMERGKIKKWKRTRSI